MKFIKTNIDVLLLGIFAILVETLHEFFTGIPFNDVVDLSAPVYYLTSQLGSSSLLTSIIIFLLIDKKRKSAKVIAFGIVLFATKNVMAEYFYITLQSTDVLKLDSVWGQLFLIISAICWAYYGFRKWKS